MRAAAVLVAAALIIGLAAAAAGVRPGLVRSQR